jgi:cobalt/nickel transport system permease protein
MASIEQRYISLSARKVNSAQGKEQAMLIVTLLYLVAVLSVPLYSPQKLIWLAPYPIIASEMEGCGFRRIFLKSLLIIPLVALIGIFNPFIDTETAFRIGNVVVNRGWVSFISILLRGLLSLQAILILVESSGIIDTINALRKLGCPSVLTTQLHLTCRYISVVMEEVIVMKRARAARGYGRKSYPLSMWGRFIGQLLIRSMQRATDIHRAMLARGFDGSLPLGTTMRWNSSAWIWLIVWTALIACLRFIDFSSLVVQFLHK